MLENLGRIFQIIILLIVTVSCQENAVATLLIGTYIVPYTNPDDTGMMYVGENYSAILVAQDSIHLITLPSITLTRDYERIVVPKVNHYDDSISIYLPQHEEKLLIVRQHSFFELSSSIPESAIRYYEKAKISEQNISVKQVYDKLVDKSYLLSGNGEVSYLEFIDTTVMLYRDTITKVPEFGNYYVAEISSEIFLVLDIGMLTKIQVLDIQKNALNGYAFVPLSGTIEMQSTNEKSERLSMLVGDWKGVEDIADDGYTNGLLTTGRRKFQTLRFSDSTINYIWKERIIDRRYKLYPNSGILTVGRNDIWSVKMLDDSTMQIISRIDSATRSEMYDKTIFKKLN